MLAIGLGPEFLPPTEAIFGRRSKPMSHQLYVSDLHETETAAAIQYKDGNAVIVELRIAGGGLGATTVVPPFMHASGELVQWASDGEPARVAGTDLKCAVLKLAVACLLKPHYPGEGLRHEGALVLGGMLARAGWQREDIAHVVEVVARAAGDDDVRDRVEAAANATEIKANGHSVPGFTRSGEVWGEDVAKAKTSPRRSHDGSAARRAAPARAQDSRITLPSILPNSTPTISGMSRSHHNGCGGRARTGNPKTRSAPSTNRASCAA
jgi:hypothetical protein